MGFGSSAHEVLQRKMRWFCQLVIGRGISLALNRFCDFRRLCFDFLHARTKEHRPHNFKQLTATMVAPSATATATTTATAAPLLNVYKKVAVIRIPSDSLTYEDAEGNQKSVSIQELGDAISSAVSCFVECYSTV